MGWYQRRVHGIITIFFIFSLICIQSIIYIFHPIFFSFILIAISLLVSIIVFKLNSSCFFLIILVFLGGVIILIIYINTLAINEKFFFTKNNFIKINTRNSIALLIYENINFYIIIFLILYLLLTLICVVKLIKFEHGPLIKRL